jgi:hypothetical protein
MQLETTRFGRIDVDEGAVLTFTQPTLELSDYPVRFNLRLAQAGARSPQEVSHARTDS